MPIVGFTFDTGALLALERRNDRISAIWGFARKHDRTITIPAPVVTEWWRGRSDRRDDILAGVMWSRSTKSSPSSQARGSRPCPARHASMP
jgi:hypothetical protein